MECSPIVSLDPSMITTRPGSKIGLLADSISSFAASLSTDRETDCPKLPKDQFPCQPHITCPL